MTSQPRIVVVGAGISGLAAAYFIDEALREGNQAGTVTVLESAGHPGGTMRTEAVDGFRVEWGANGFLTNKPHTLELARRLGLEPALLPSSDQARKRFILANGKLHSLPASPGALMRTSLMPLSGRLRVLAEPLARRPPAGVDETLADFASRRLGKEAMATLIDPMASGIFAGDSTRLSVAAAFPRIVELERTHGSLFLGMMRTLAQRRKSGDGGDAGGPAGPGGVLTSFQEGMGQLTQTLAQRLGDRLHPNAPVVGIRSRSEGGFQVQTKETQLAADHLVLAVPAYVASGLLADVDDGLAQVCAQIPYAPVAVVALGWRRADLGHSLDGFGFLAPSREGRRILGSLWTSSIYPHRRAPSDCVLLRNILGGARHPELVDLSEDALVDLVREELGHALGLSGGRAPTPLFVRVVKWPRAIPQYEVGHLERVRRMEERVAKLSGLHMCGNAWYGVAVNDCIDRAAQVARTVCASVPA